MELGEKSPKRELSEKYWREIIGTLAQLLDTVYCPILFCDYRQEIWRKAFILPIIDCLKPLIEKAVLSRWKKYGRQAIRKALERVDRWILEQFVSEFAHPDDTINARCQRWRQAIDALDGQLPSYPRKKGTIPALIIRVKYQQILKWCHEVAREIPSFRNTELKTRWIATYLRPLWFPSGPSRREGGLESASPRRA